MEMRRREREKRHREMDIYSDSDDIGSRGSSPRHRRDKSPIRRSRVDGNNRTKRRLVYIVSYLEEIFRLTLMMSCSFFMVCIHQLLEYPR